MEVLKPGKDVKSYSVDIECTGNGNGDGGCGALLRAKRDDMRYFPGVPGDGYGSRDAAVSIRCPICKVVTDLKAHQWPPQYRALQQYNTDHLKYDLW